MGAVGSAAVAAAVWLTAVGLAGPAGVQAATQTEIVAIEEADVHESLNRFLEEKEANAVALVEDWERKSPASEASLSEAGDASEESVAAYINRSYRVPLEEARQLTAWALEIGQGFDVDPLLILSVAATESSFNPKAKNGSGAEGLMQVMTSVHTEKFKAFGGAKAAMEPYPNMVVGASILARLIDRTGSVSQGLKHYYGAGNQSSDNGYAAKNAAVCRSLQPVTRTVRWSSREPIGRGPHTTRNIVPAILATVNGCSSWKRVRSRAAV